MTSSIYGQEIAKKILTPVLNKKNYNHAYLFVGPDGSGRDELAMLLAGSFFCTSSGYPCDNCISCKKMLHGNMLDFHEIAPDGNSIKIGQIREIKYQMSLRPADGNGHVFFIRRAEAMTKDAANSFLKVLEEPLDGVLFILVAANTGSLLSTIVSRCQIVPFYPYQRIEIANILIKDYPNISASQIERIAALGNGNLEKARRMIEYYDEDDLFYHELTGILESLLGGNPLTPKIMEFHEKNKDRMDDILSFYLMWLRDVILAHYSENSSIFFHTDNIEKLIMDSSMIDISDYVKAILYIEKSLRKYRFNVNYRIEMENILLNIGKFGGRNNL